LPPEPDIPATLSLVVAPGGRDAHVIGELLGSARLAYEADPDGERLLQALTSGGAAGAIITDGAWARTARSGCATPSSGSRPGRTFPSCCCPGGARRGRDRARWKIWSTSPSSSGRFTRPR
jgi:hypothetical protein